MDALEVLQVDLADGLGVGGLEHERDGVRLADLDVSLEDFEVAKAFVKGGEGHDLRDGAKGKDGLVAEQGEVFEGVDGVLHDVEGHFGEGVAGELCVFGLAEVLWVGDILAPDGLGPEEAAVVDVFSKVAEDVDFLEAEAHGVGQGELQAELGAFEVGGAEEHGEALTDEAGDVVAVEVKVFKGFEGEDVVVSMSLLSVVRHAEAHLLANGADDLLVPFWDGRVSARSLLYNSASGD